MNQCLIKVLRHYWLVFFVVALGLLSTYTSSPIYGAPAETPTPDVQTVPKPIILDTPTNTPFPTPTPSNNTDMPSGGGPAATRAPSDNQGNDGDNQSNNDHHDSQGSTQPGNVNPTATSPAAGSGSTANPATNATPGAGPQTTGSAGGLTGVVNVVTLNVRKGPGTSEHIVDTLFMDDRVEVRGRDSTGKWWYVCCGAGSQRAGWVSAQFISPDFAGAEATTLLPVLDNRPTPIATKNDQATPPVTGTPQATETPGSASTPSAETSTPLLMSMRAQPAFAWQGQQIQLQLVLRNSGNQGLTALHLRNDLPPELALLEATVSDGGAYHYTGAADRGPLLTIDWPSLPAAAQVSATLTLQIRADTPVDVLIDNLAAATSAEGVEALAGLTLAMPPTGLPQFR